MVNAILTEMEEDDAKILSHGLLTMNREESQVDGNTVVDYLLLHSAIDNVHHQDKQWQQQRINEVRDYAQSRKTLPIPQNESDTHFDDMDWDILDGIDVDVVLDEVDKKEQELGSPVDGGINVYIPSKISKTPSITTKTNENGTVVYAINITDNSGQSIPYSEIDDDEEEFLSDEEFEDQYSKLHKNYSLKSDATTSTGASSIDIEKRRISIGRFRAIMDKSEKKYDVDQVVEDLNDGTGHIALKDIATYHKKIQTMTNVFDHQSVASGNSIPAPEAITLAKTV